jgi:hypothetical protein
MPDSFTTESGYVVTFMNKLQYDGLILSVHFLCESSSNIIDVSMDLLFYIGDFREIAPSKLMINTDRSALVKQVPVLMNKLYESFTTSDKAELERILDSDTFSITPTIKFQYHATTHTTKMTNNNKFVQVLGATYTLHPKRTPIESHLSNQPDAIWTAMGRLSSLVEAITK